MMLDLDGSKELLRDGWRDVNDADRCISMGISPAAGTLHRRLRDVLNNSNALVAEIERQRAELGPASTAPPEQAPGVNQLMYPCNRGMPQSIARYPHVFVAGPGDRIYCQFCGAGSTST